MSTENKFINKIIKGIFSYYYRNSAVFVVQKVRFLYPFLGPIWLNCRGIFGIILIDYDVENILFGNFEKGR